MKAPRATKAQLACYITEPFQLALWRTKLGILPPSINHRRGFPWRRSQHTWPVDMNEREPLDSTGAAATATRRLRVSDASTSARNRSSNKRVIIFIITRAKKNHAWHAAWRRRDDCCLLKRTSPKRTRVTSVESVPVGSLAAGPLPGRPGASTISVNLNIG